MSMVEHVQTYGGNAGTPFGEITEIRSIAFSAGTFVDRIIINGVPYGGPGGTPTETLTLGDDEYISGVLVMTGDVLDYMHVATNKGRWLKSGNRDANSGGALRCNFEICRLQGIWGMVGHWQNFPLPVISRIGFRAQVPNPPFVTDECNMLIPHPPFPGF